MKFNPFDWSEVTTDEIEFVGGAVRMKCSETAAFYIECLGHEVLAHVGNELDLKISEPCRVSLDCPDSARVFAYRPFMPVFEPIGEKFTNADRKPHESGAMLEVKRALRELEFKQREFMAQQRRAAQADRPAPAPAPEPDPEPDPQPHAEPDADQGAGDA